MTQDPYGQPPGSGYVVRGEVVPDDEANVTPPTTPMTHFQKVASALRGDRTDPAIPIRQETDPADPGVPDAEAYEESGRDADATHPEEVGAVRSPDDGSRDYWDEAEAAGRDTAGRDEAGRDEAGRDEAAAAASAESAPAADLGTWPTRQDEEDPTATQPDLHGTSAHASTDVEADTDADEAGVTEADASAAEAGAGEAGVVGAAEPDAVGAAEPAAAGAAEPAAAGVAEADAAGAAEPAVAGKHAGAPMQEGLRPGESDIGLGDFSELTYGSLLPDGAEFKTRWQQVQFRFVDDPQGSVTEAADVIAQVTAKLEAAIAERQRAIAERQRTLRDRWSQGKSTDTESLRETLLMYRTFLDQLTGPKAG
jgi:hypothetical protein